MDFKSMMAARKNRIGKVQQQLEKESKKGSYEDDRFWKLQHDNGNGMAVIRFLPETNGEDDLWIKYYHHAFKGPNGWFIDNCLTSIGEKCPVCEANSVLYDNNQQDGGPEYVEHGRPRKRILKYVSNIYVIKDPVNPENEGKVFLFQYGPQIHKMILAQISPPEPEFEGESAKEPVDIFDFLEGRNFRLRMKKKNQGGYPTYESSEFDGPSQIAETDEEIETIWNSQHSLQQFLAKDFYKSFDELNDRFRQVLGVTENAINSTQESVASYQVNNTEDEYEEVIKPKSKRVTKPAPKREIEEDADDEMAFFNKLAEE